MARRPTASERHAAEQGPSFDVAFYSESTAPNRPYGTQLQAASRVAPLTPVKRFITVL